MTTRALMVFVWSIALVPALGCARAQMQGAAAQVAGAVDELRADVETHQLIRTELARSGVERVARGEAEVATREASRAAYRVQLSKAAKPLLRHSRAIAEGADPGFAPTLATEVERRETGVGYRRHVETLESLAALLERLADGALPDSIGVYLQLGAEAAEAAEGAWTRTTRDNPR